MVYGKYYKDSSGSSFFSQSTFVGEMAGINVWDRVLSEAELSEMSKSCTSGKGNIVSMVELKIMGGVKKNPRLLLNWPLFWISTKPLGQL